MPIYTPKSVEEILSDAINYLVLNSKITDFNVGSAVRTLFEAMALEQGEIYTEGSKILKAFFLEGAVGKDLVSRGEEYDVFMFPATPSTGSVVFLDTQLERSFITSDVISGDTTITVVDTTVFPGTFPFTIKLGEGTGSLETASVTASSAVDNTITLSAGVAYAHAAASSSIDEIDNLGSLVTLVSGDPSRIIPSGISLRSKGSNVNISVEAYTSTNGTLLNGYFASSTVSVITKQVGASTVIPVKRLNSVVGSPPFSGASVVNQEEISGGSSPENPSDFKSRIRRKIGGLSAGVKSALISALLEVSEATTSQKISKVNILEAFAERTVYAYINPGLGTFVGEKDEGITDTLSVLLAPSSTTLQVSNATDFPQASEGDLKYLILDTDNASSGLQTVQYQELVSNSMTLTSAEQIPPAPALGLPAGTQVAVPYIISTSAIANKKYYNINQFPIVRDSFSLYVLVLDPAASPPISNSTTTKLVKDTDYLLNEAVGQVEFFTATTSPDGLDHLPPVGSVLMAVFDSYTGLIKNAQDTLDGSLVSPSTYPGVRSAGVKALVEPANRELIDFIINLVVDIKVTSEATAKFLTQQVIIAYITSLDIGATVILTDIIDKVKDIPGIKDLEIKSPTGNVTVLHDHFADIGTLTVT